MAVYFGTNKVLDNGVGGTSLVLGHGETHAAAGSDPITPESIGAAPAEHAHDYAPMPFIQTVTLPQSAWTVYSYGCVQTVSVQNMRGSSLALVASHPNNYDEYMAARVRCSVQGWGALTFASKKLPSYDLNVNILIMGGTT
ncbi:MAG: hypothetical protein EOM66_06145 [Clostridia bacterium]|nr:hypothetical protein [Candidatus Pelethousia sp.]NCB30973.1 hypothetical protein [Clostridia bacterium]